MITEDIGRQFC